MPDYANNPAYWAASSRATLCRVAWDDSYRDVVRFPDEAARAAYFDSLSSESIEISKMTYLKPNEPIKLDVPYNAVFTYNYLIVDNPRQGVPGEADPIRLYYFVQGVRYVAPNTTQVTVSLDCFQTYLYKFRFGRCFIERGHVGLATLEYHRSLGEAFFMRALKRFATAAEGLDVGSEYVVRAVDFFDVSSDGWAIVITSNVDLAADWGSKESPGLTTADAQYTDGLFSGCNVYTIESQNAESFFKKVKDYPWISKGIVSITCFPKALLTDGPEVKIGGITMHFLGTTPDKGAYFTAKTGIYDRFIAENEYEYMRKRYRNVSKLCAYPYAYVELTNLQGNSVLLKPELLKTAKLSLDVASLAATGNARVAFYPPNYANDGGAANPKSEYQVLDDTEPMRTRTVDVGNWTDNAVWFQGFPTFSIVNDEYVNYIASNANRLSWSYDSAGWAQQRSLAANQLTYDQANAQLSTNQANKDIQNVADLASGAIGAVSSIASGSPAGALSTAAGTGVGLVSSNMQFGNAQRLGYQFANQNKNLADWSARGDYQNQIAQINATVQDAALTQPSQSGQIGGDGFNLANGMMAVLMRYRAMDMQHVRIVGDYFLRYGYAVQMFGTLPDDLMCCERFTYWKLSETYLACAEADESVKNTIRGIFEKGVTVWRDPADLGNIELDDNEPIEKGWLD